MGRLFIALISVVTLIAGCSNSGSDAKLAATNNLGQKFLDELTGGSSARLGARLAIAESAAEFKVTELVDAAVADVLDSTDGFSRQRNLDSGETSGGGLGEAAPEFVAAVVARLDDPTFYKDTNSPPSDADRVAVAEKVVEVVTKALGSSDGAVLAAADKETLLGDVSETIPISLHQAGLSDISVVDFADNLTGKLINSLDDAGYSDDEVIGLVAEVSEGASAGFAKADLSDALADDFMNNMAAEVTIKFVALGFSSSEMNSGIGKFLQGAAQGTKELGTNGSTSEANAFLQGMIESIDSVYNIDEATVAGPIEAGLLASGMSTADAASVKTTTATYNPATMAPDLGAISAAATAPVISR